jgi:hypothetical protein
MAMKGDGVGESQAEYRELVDDEHEHRFAEHDHEHEYRSGARIGRARAQPLAAVLVLVIERPLRWLNGKRSPNDRARFLDIARGSALECAAIQDVLVADSDGDEGRRRGRIASRVP